MECCSIFDGVVKLVSSMALPEVHTDRGDLRVHESLEELSTDLVDYIDEISETSMKERGVFAIVLSGGSLIATNRIRDAVDESEKPLPMTRRRRQIEEANDDDELEIVCEIEEVDEEVKMFAEVQLTSTNQELGTWYYQGINKGGNLYPAPNSMENMQDVSIEPDSDDAGHRMEAKDIMPRTRSRTRIQKCDDNGDGSQCPDPIFVGARYDDVQHAQSPLREDPSDIQQDRGHHFTPPMDPNDPSSFIQDRSNIQWDSRHHFTPPVDTIDHSSLSQEPSNIQRDR
ncbi:hypothetical protein LWI28_003022 [Acer negundo]|uniref:Uncharacterized protein n=1 Tax=Acer negundo TaxID=4023 RepID=A0AAD5NNS3_ACENE|nr:hypothetical protein LWI28_003022 [Acer negundo]